MATFVLVHGAYQGGWIWMPVVDRLRKAGHQVYAPSLDGCAERHHLVRPDITVATHAQEIAQLMFYEDLHDVVLVGTSSGGMVVCKAAELARGAHRPARVRRRAGPDDGREGRRHRQTRLGQRDDVDHDRSDARDLETRVFGDLEPELRAWARARCTPHPIAALEAPVELGASGHKPGRRPSSAAGAPRIRQRRNQRRTAERLKGAWHELDTGHYPMLSQPDELTRLLLGAVS
jgi:pimeloyl-ACP methyl ester carboxylesterase